MRFVYSLKPGYARFFLYVVSVDTAHTVYGNRRAIIGRMNASDSRDAANQVMALIERMAKRRHGEP
ncbi:hypothetical protein PACILC2_55830 [Paenibacillus cisolokensis]|uniref:WGR domain-containing protein n=1 Tax=Paenibacillus cisolokensis TaxID=1658519 RepID=A0ABQ4NFL8_9BACL|nr:hypothetical protein PACILC2_55830 [Paenibacillus cisolokensis]